MVSGVSLALGGVTIVPSTGATAGRPSARGNWCGPSSAGTRAPSRAVASGVVAVVTTLGREGLETDECGDGDRDEGSDDGFLGEEGDEEEFQNSQSAELDLGEGQKRQDLLQDFLLATT